MLKKRISDLEKRIQDYRNKTVELQEGLKSVRKKCDDTINKLSNKNLEILWKIDHDKELLNKLRKLPPRVFSTRKKTSINPVLSSIQEDSGKSSKRKSSRKIKRKSSRKGKRKSSRKGKRKSSRKSKRKSSRKGKRKSSRKSKRK